MADVEEETKIITDLLDKSWMRTRLRIVNKLLKEMGIDKQVDYKKIKCNECGTETGIFSMATPLCFFCGSSSAKVVKYGLV